MDPKEVWDFNPEEVPTVQQLLRESKAVQKSKKGEAKTTGTSSPLFSFPFHIQAPWHNSNTHVTGSFALHCAVRVYVRDWKPADN
jgi:hypothetical protein